MTKPTSFLWNAPNHKLQTHNSMAPIRFPYGILSANFGKRGEMKNNVDW
jgi:hypothetical protein